jgi:hypothetical protein
MTPKNIALTITMAAIFGSGVSITEALPCRS